MSLKRTQRGQQARARAKISTTVAPETHAYLQRLVARGDATTLADALDILVQRQIEDDRRADLERRTAEYYETLSDEEVAEQRAWGEFSEAEMSDPNREHAQPDAVAR
jgi:hypothetical protein